MMYTGRGIGPDHTAIVYCMMYTGGGCWSRPYSYGILYDIYREGCWSRPYSYSILYDAYSKKRRKNLASTSAMLTLFFLKGARFQQAMISRASSHISTDHFLRPHAFLPKPLERHTYIVNSMRPETGLRANVDDRGMVF